jgi:type I restriction enzyme S subunit
MDVKPDYKQTEAGMIPGSWEVAKLGDGVTLLSGQHVLARHYNTDGDGVPYITGPSDFPDGVIRHTKFTTKPGTICQANDILITVKGSGVGALALADESYCISRQLMAMRTNKWSIQYVYFCLLRDGSLFGAAASGPIPGLSRSDILNKSIPLPPTKAEQEAIAESLSDADAFIESLEQLIAKKRHLKQGAMQELLSGKTRLSGFEVNSGYKQTEVGMIPKDWEIANLSCLSKEPMQNGVFYKPSLKGVGVKLINVGDLYVRTPIDLVELELFNASAIERERFKVADGDLFFTRSSVVPSGIAHCNIYRADGSECVVFDSHVIRMRPDTQKVVPAFLFRFCVASIARHYLVSHAKTATMTTIDQQVLAKCPVILPSLAEQEAIAAILSDMEAVIAALESKLTKARQLKEGVMQELLTGTVRLI